jgi:hypothetical protein
MPEVRNDAAETPPACDRHQRLKLHLVRHLRERERGWPTDAQSSVEIGHHAAALEIGLERAELEFAAAETGIGSIAIHWPAGVVACRASVARLG